jgi:hypothetical protein
MARATVEDPDNGLVTVNAEIGASPEELALMFFQVMVGSGFHASKVIQSMESVVQELIVAYNE